MKTRRFPAATGLLAPAMAGRARFEDPWLLDASFNYR